MEAGVATRKFSVLDSALLEPREPAACLPPSLQLGVYGTLRGMFWEPLEPSPQSHSRQQHCFVLMSRGAVSGSYTKYEIVQYKEANVLGGHIPIYSELIASCRYVDADQAKWKHSGK